MAKKMMLIDPRLLESMTQKPYVPPDTLNDSLRDLDNQMQQVLDREDLSARDKARQYQQILQRYMGRFAEYRHKPLGLVDIKPSPVTNTTNEQPPPPEEVHKTEESVETRQKKDDDEIEITSPPNTNSKKKSKIPTPVKWDEWNTNSSTEEVHKTQDPVEKRQKKDDDTKRTSPPYTRSKKKKSKIPTTTVKWDGWNKK